MRPCDANLRRLEEHFDETERAIGYRLDDFLSNNSEVTCLEELSIGGDGRATVQIGDVAAAKDVVILPPSNGQSLYNLPITEFGNNIRNASGGKVAVIVWLGYNVPDGMPQAVWGETPSHGEFRKLGSLANGLAGRGKHVTMVGYSYGAVALEGAAGTGGARVQDMVFVGGWTNGSPVWANGMGGANVWYGVHGRTDHIADVRHINGGRFFSTGGATGHDGYDQVGSESLRNIAHIASGQYGDVTCHGGGDHCRRGL
jgi:hypothetical protein